MAAVLLEDIDWDFYWRIETTNVDLIGNSDSIICKEFEVALKTTKNKSATRSDRIAIELIKYAAGKFILKFCLFLNKCRIKWKVLKEWTLDIRRPSFQRENTQSVKIIVSWAVEVGLWNMLHNCCWKTKTYSGHYCFRQIDSI
jgi:hypothetical protein